MIPKLTLQQFIDSKEQLLEALRLDPIVTLTYTCLKYTKLIVIAEDDTEHVISFKPKDKIQLKWKYNILEECFDEHSHISRECLSLYIDESQYTIIKSMNQLERWLKVNTLQLRN